MAADDAELERMNRNAMIGSLASSGENVLKVLGGRGLAIIRTTKLTKSFVLGSRPVVKLTPPGTTELSDHSVEMWLPVAPDVAVGVGREPGEELLFDAPDRFVRGLNEAVLEQSSMLVARSEDLLKSLCRLR
ncbi:MAG: hypothetical protein K0R85_180 [Devosia sp.]|jgi:hypothetical protein|nr:hypothetical protein [Devosia sp.]